VFLPHENKKMNVNIIICFKFKMDIHQKRCIDIIESRKNIFITGSAGTGKSFTISQIYKKYKDSRNIYLTAMTGCAAILLHPSATTLHAWAGVGLGKLPVLGLYKKIIKNKKAYQRWKKTDILIIDEVSMLGPELFEKLDSLGRKIRNNHFELFGGIQMVLVGDFFQLPPVEEEKFLFESNIFQKHVLERIELKNVYRQKNDLGWYQILQNIRSGKLSSQDQKILESRIRHDMADIMNHSCTLYPINRMVNTENNNQLHRLNSKIYTMNIGIKNPNNRPKEDIDEIIHHFHVPEKINLSIGARVMLTWNLDLESGLVNGSQGVIVGFTSKLYPVIQFDSLSSPITLQPKEYSYEELQCGEIEEDSKKKLSVFQFPLRLSWALSIHKVQGISLSSAMMDLGQSVFEYGQAYVALSRIQSLDGVILLSFDPVKIKVNQRVLDFYSSFSK
jgi:ATP-dependent DNA helicase PIF1